MLEATAEIRSCSRDPTPRRARRDAQRARCRLRDRDRDRRDADSGPAGRPGRVRAARARPALRRKRGQAGGDRRRGRGGRGARTHAATPDRAARRPSSGSWPTSIRRWSSWRRVSAARASWISTPARSCRGSAERVEPVAIWIPLAVGASALAVTILIHALAVSATVNFGRRQMRAGRAGARFWTDAAIVAAVISFLLGAHLLEIFVLGGVPHRLRRVSRVFPRLLPLGRELHHPGLRETSS